MTEPTKNADVSSPLECVVSDADQLKLNMENTIFDLMFHGCQHLNVPQSVELINKIKEGKIRGVTMQDGYLD